MRLIIIAAVAGPCLALAACTGSDEAAACNAADLGPYVGRRATPELVTEVQAAAAARVVRVVHPGDVITMDYRADRLTIDVDATDIIAALRCG